MKNHNSFLKLMSGYKPPAARTNFVQTFRKIFVLTFLDDDKTIQDNETVDLAYTSWGYAWDHIDPLKLLYKWPLLLFTALYYGLERLTEQGATQSKSVNQEDAELTYNPGRIAFRVLVCGPFYLLYSLVDFITSPIKYIVTPLANLAKAHPRIFMMAVLIGLALGVGAMLMVFLAPALVPAWLVTGITAIWHTVCSGVAAAAFGFGWSFTTFHTIALVLTGAISGLLALAKLSTVLFTAAKITEASQKGHFKEISESETIKTLKDSAIKTAGHVSEEIGKTAEKVSSDLTNSATDLAERLKQTANEISSSISDTTQQVSNDIQSTFHNVFHSTTTQTGESLEQADQAPHSQNDILQ